MSVLQTDHKEVIINEKDCSSVSGGDLEFCCAGKWNEAISFVASLCSLSRLMLTGGQVSDISHLASLFQLHILVLEETLIDLETLNVRGNQIADVSPLMNLGQLVRLVTEL